jgi:hypothetical protein
MITINYNYYNNLDLFKWVRDYYKCLDIKKFHFTIIDDGSQEIPLPKSEVPEDWSFFRVTEDIGWNCNGARNLLMQETKTEWNLNIDLDRVVAPQSLYFLRNHSLDPDKMYHFSSLPHTKLAKTLDKIYNYTWQQDEKDKNSAFKCAFNTYICTKNLFWDQGKGYAELAHGGEYGGDYLFLDKFKPWQMHPDLYIFNIVHDASYSKEWKQQSIKKWGKYRPGTDNKVRIGFKWEQIQ